jgi:hypothetical protein
MFGDANGSGLPLCGGTGVRIWPRGSVCRLLNTLSATMYRTASFDFSRALPDFKNRRVFHRLPWAVLSCVLLPVWWWWWWWWLLLNGVEDRPGLFETDADFCSPTSCDKLLHQAAHHSVFDTVRINWRIISTLIEATSKPNRD